MLSSTTELLAALRSRETELEAKQREALDEWNKLNLELEAVNTRGRRIHAELSEVRALIGRYDMTPPIPAENSGSAKPTVREAILSTLTAEKTRSLPYEDLIRRVVAMHKAGHLTTSSTSDSRKLVASTIGNLWRSNKINRSGDTVFWVAPSDQVEVPF